LGDELIERRWEMEEEEEEEQVQHLDEETQVGVLRVGGVTVLVLDAATGTDVDTLT